MPIIIPKVTLHGEEYALLASIRELPAYLMARGVMGVAAASFISQAAIGLASRRSGTRWRGFNFREQLDDEPIRVAFDLDLTL
jgi:hypothetical protein